MPQTRQAMGTMMAVNLRLVVVIMLSEREAPVPKTLFW